MTETQMNTFPPALPHGSITAVTEGVYAVRGSFKMGPGVRIGRTMTIARAKGELVIFNPVRLSEEGEKELEELGPVAHMVKLSDSHSIDEPYYLDRYDAKLWAFPGAKLEGIHADEALEGEGPITGGRAVLYTGNEGWCEGAYLIPGGGGTLVSCDALQNCADHELSSFGGRMVAWMIGSKGGVIVPKIWRRFQKRSGDGVRETLGPLQSLEFEHLVTGHGPAVVGQASELVRRAIDAAAAA